MTKKKGEEPKAPPNTDATSLLSAREFFDCGVHQELNRRLLHPMGLSAELAEGEGDEPARIVIVDLRKAPDPAAFPDAPSKPLEAAVNAAVMRNVARRLARFGSIQQPCGADEA